MSRNSVMIESLEDRRLLSAAVLGPSAVEGTYKGSATGDGSSLVLKLVISARKETLTIEGYGSGAVKLSASAFKKLREGKFSYDGKVKSLTVKISGKVTDSGLRISGSGTISSKTTVSGTFLLKK